MKRLIAGNWKMNFTQAETRAFFEAIDFSNWDPERADALLFAPMLSLECALDASKRKFAKGAATIAIGAQNAHWEKKGAFTGEVSGPMLEELGIKQVLIGHSERRQHFGETDETVLKRVESLLAQGFRVMACVGETRAEREGGQTFQVLERQIAGLSKIANEKLTLAYEPVWAIGTGLTASPEQAQEVHAFLRKRFPKTLLLYGGSVTPENLASLLAQKDINGALVGGASLKPENYAQLLGIASLR